MKRQISILVVVTMITAALFSADAFAQRRRGVVVVRRPAPARRTLVIHAGHPIHRTLPREVVVRPARKTVVVRSPLVFLPVVTWRAAVVTLPSRERLVWQDSETITRDEDWVDTNFGIEESGNALLLDINGRTKLNFAEVTFANGNVQVVDFDERTHGSGIYNLLDFADGRRVATVRVLAKSESEDSKLSVYLSK